MSYADGDFLKINSDTSIPLPNYLDILLHTISKNYNEKNLLFFTNNTVSNKEFEFIYPNLNYYVKNISYYSNWVSAFGLWKEDFNCIKNSFVRIMLQKFLKLMFYLNFYLKVKKFLFKIEKFMML